MFESIFTFLEQSPIAVIAVYLPLILIPILVAMFDFVTLTLAKFKKSYGVTKVNRSDDFSVLIPIFGNMSYLKNREFLRPYGKKVVICTTTKESKEFYSELEEISKEYGFRVFKSDVVLASAKHKPNPWKLFHKALDHEEMGTKIVADLARDEIIKDSFSAVRSTYCIFLDGDTVAVDPLNELVGDFIARKYDIASVRVLASKEDTLAERLQAIEYKLAMDARKIYPWLTSGASMVAKTKVINHIMSNHSLFFSGGDIEIGKLARLLKYNVGHIPSVFLTDVPETFKAWFKQRIAWCGGGFRHAIINIHSFTWRHPFFFIYVTIIVYALTPLRWYEVIVHPLSLVYVIIIYWMLLFIFHWRERSIDFFFFPFYALVQVMVIVPLGIIRYFKMAYTSKNIGLIKIRRKLMPSGKRKTIILVRDITKI